MWQNSYFGRLQRLFQTFLVCIARGNIFKITGRIRSILEKWENKNCVRRKQFIFECFQAYQKIRSYNDICTIALSARRRWIFVFIEISFISFHLELISGNLWKICWNWKKFLCLRSNVKFSTRGCLTINFNSFLTLHHSFHYSFQSMVFCLKATKTQKIFWEN